MRGWKGTSTSSAFNLKHSHAFIVAPEKPNVKTVLETYIELTFSTLTDNSHAYTYQGEAKGADGKSHRIDCDVDESICQFTDLKPAHLYKMFIRSCFSPAPGENLCSANSVETTSWTKPSGVWQVYCVYIHQVSRLPIPFFHFLSSFSTHRQGVLRHVNCYWFYKATW